MIFKARNSSILRYGLIVFLTVLISSSAFYLYFHYNKAANIRHNFRKVIQNRGNSDLIDSCVLALFDAGTNSRMYALTKDSVHFGRFLQNINFVSNAIHKINPSRPQGLSVDGRRFDDLLQQKSQRTQDYFRLLALTDSLLKITKKVNEQSVAKGKSNFRSVIIKQISAKVSADSVTAASLPKPKKRRFFSRVFNAFSRKKSEEQLNEAQESSIKAVKIKVDSIIKHTTLADKSTDLDADHYRNLASLNNEINKTALQLSAINSELINAIIIDLRKYKKEEQIYIQSSNVALDDNLQEVIYDFKQISALFFVLLAIVVVLVLYNIWKIFQNEEKLVSTTVSAQETAKSKTAFLASMSHEIRTPLNSVIGFSEQLMDSNLNPVQTEQVQAINSSSKMLLHVVNEILDFSKYETGKMHLEKADFKPYNALKEVFTNMEILAANKGLKLIRDLKVDPEACISGDQLRLKQVLINLLNNAIKFTTQGNIVLKAWTGNDTKGMLTLYVQVIDSGIGIDKDNLPTIFEEFTQVESAQHKTTQKGTGLGLAIVKKIIELQGGSIGVTSKVGEGSTFSFQLNYEMAKPAAIASTDSNMLKAADTDLSGKHVLVADDNELNLLLVTTILKKWKATYDTVVNGADALRLIQENQYDILLTDIEMPLMGGVELSKTIRALDSAIAEIPILALTANALKEDTNKYLEAGMDGVIVKPITEKDFIKAVKTALISNPAVATLKGSF